MGERGETRLLSLDAYRGFIMMGLVAGQPFLLGLTSIAATKLPFFDFLPGQFAHVPWAGYAFWDLIAPSFALMVGVSLPYSYASRIAKGQTSARIRLHVLYRSVVFILLGTLLLSRNDTHTRFEFTTLLSQFGLAYPFAAAIVGRGLRFQSVAALLIIIGWWLAFAVYPLPPADFDFASVGLPPDWDYFTGFFAHWNRGANIAADFDVWFLNLFPRDEVYRFHRIGQQTLNFIPKIVTMMLGVIVGEMFRSERSKQEKLRWLLLAGLALLGTGLIAGSTVCPLVRRLWTSSWILFSGGCTLLMMGGFFWAVDIRGWSKLAFPFVVVGMNSMAMYLMDGLFKPWVLGTVQIHLIDSWTLEQAVTVLVLWVVCFWMYRRRIFLRV